MKYLDTAASVAMLVASLAVIWSVAIAPGNARPISRVQDYTIGEMWAAGPGLDLALAPMTLVMYLNTRCKYCDESMPFYRSLGQQAPQIRLVAVGMESTEELERYVLEHGFRPAQVLSIRPGTTRLRGTPTLLLIDASARITGVWLGKLDPQRELEVAKALSTMIDPQRRGS